MTPPRIRTRSGRRPRARFHASWSPAARVRSRKTVIRAVGIIGGLLAVLLLGANVYAVSFLDGLPSVRNIDLSQLQGDTFIQDRGGQLLADVGGQSGADQGNRRATVTLDQISPKIVEATVAIEDRTFWTNPGFEPSAIVRTAANNFRAGGITGGASTITQQLAKQLFLTNASTFGSAAAVQSLQRKAKEIVLAYEMTQTYSKRQIMELYLNISFYGSQQYGVQAAAQTYFHRDAKAVDLAQAALLAGLPQSPDNYDPVAHFDAAKARQQEVLDAMVATGDISQSDAVAAFNEPLQVSPPVNNYKAPRFVGYVLRELQALGFNPGQQQLTVKTTLDLGKQALAEQIISDNYKKNLHLDEKGGRLSSAMVAMDPKTGQILAYVGSQDPANDQFDYVDQVHVNPGSSVKPFTYGKAILDGKITMTTPIVDGPSPYVLQWEGHTYKFENYDTRTHGTPQAKQALASSLNIPAIKVEMTEGMSPTVDFYRQMGIFPVDPAHPSDPNSPDTDYGPSLTLGGYGITLLQEVSALSAYADMGLYHQPEAILQVTDAKGQVLYQADPNRTGSVPGAVRQAVDPGVAYIVGAMISDDNNRRLAFTPNGPLHLPDRQAAAKTGTSENFHDGLTIGFTPDLASVFWIGDTGGTNPRTGELYHLANGSDGVIVAAPAWHAFMEAALKGVPDHWYQMPADVIKQGNDYFLKSTPTKIDHLAGDNPSPSPSAAANGVPPDPGAGPRPVVDPRLCQGFIRLPGCPSPSPGVPVGG